MEVTKREILVSIAIFFIMLGFGFLISQNISERTEETNEEYRKALKIEDLETYDYAKQTGINNCFTIFQLDAITPQSIPELKGEYLYIERDYEVEHQKTRVVTETHTDSKGKTYTTERVETYWEWDHMGTDTWESPQVAFNGMTYDIDRFSGYGRQSVDPSDSSVFDENAIGARRTTYSYAYLSSHKRYSYEVVPIHLEGSAYIKFSNNELPKSVRIHPGTSVESLYQSKLSSATAWIVLFWTIWIALTGGLIFGYCYLDNDYLEDDNGKSLRRNRWRRW